MSSDTEDGGPSESADTDEVDDSGRDESSTVDKDAPTKLPSYMHKIVKYLQDEFIKGEHRQHTYKNLLKACKLVNLTQNELSYLNNKALVSNPLINVEIKESLNGDYRRYFSYKPPYDVTSKSSLLRILKQRFYYGRGALAMDDLEKSVPNALELVKGLGSLVLITTRSGDKKQFLFYNDPDVMFKDMDPDVLERLRNIYHSVRLDGYDDLRIEKYLTENRVNRDTVELPPKLDESSLTERKRKEKRKGRRSYGLRQRIYNTHVSNLLQDYHNGVPIKNAKTSNKAGLYDEEDDK
ncbi:hypothetical protein ACOME3_007313 [Neoechinorhynchus agilis]